MPRASPRCLPEWMPCRSKSGNAAGLAALRRQAQTQRVEPASVDRRPRAQRLALWLKIVSSRARERAAPEALAQPQASTRRSSWPTTWLAIPVATRSERSASRPAASSELAGIFRDPNLVSDVETNFGAIPFRNSPLSRENEFRFSARQSRFSGMFAAKIDPQAEITGYFELDFLGVPSPRTPARATATCLAFASCSPRSIPSTRAGMCWRGKPTASSRRTRSASRR